MTENPKVWHTDESSYKVLTAKVSGRDIFVNNSIDKFLIRPDFKAFCEAEVAKELDSLKAIKPKFLPTHIFDLAVDLILAKTRETFINNFEQIWAVYKDNTFHAEKFIL